MAKGNGNDGFLIANASNITIGGPNAADGNLISGNHVGGQTSGTCNNLLIQNNSIGVDRSGTVAMANSWNELTLGATSANSQVLNNVIAGGSFQGLDIGGGNTNLLIQGNTIGVGADRITPTGMGCGFGGITGWASPGLRILDNLISGNGGPGISLSASGAVVQGNLIGVADDGIHPLGNSGFGIEVGFNASNVLIGGLTAGAGNTFGTSPNGLASGPGGVRVDANSIGVQIQGNTFWSRVRPAHRPGQRRRDVE